tara:strand:+ start:586 stop:804 length:219 start_codon:yes stop_codon:yes gene_type:complete
MTWKIKQPISYQEVEKRLHETFDKDTDYDLFHKHNGRIVVHFWDEKYLENFPHKDGRKKQVISYEPVEKNNG